MYVFFCLISERKPSILQCDLDTHTYVYIYILGVCGIWGRQYK